MTLEVNVFADGQMHTLRGERARRWIEIMARKMADNPALQHAGRLERQQAEAAAFRESAEG